MKFNIKKINKVIEEQGRMKKWVAEQIGVNNSYLISILKGRVCPSAHLVVRICAVLEIDPSDIMSGEGS